MSRARARRMTGAIFGCLVVLALNAFGTQRDAERELDDQCLRDGKTYSHSTGPACPRTDFAALPCPPLWTVFGNYGAGRSPIGDQREHDD